MSKNARPTFTDSLMAIRDGGAIEELADHVRTQVRKAQLAGKPAKVQLTLTIKPNGMNAVVVTDDIKVTEPKVVNEDSFFFTNETGDLLRHNPLQSSFREDLKENA